MVLHMFDRVCCFSVKVSAFITILMDDPEVLWHSVVVWMRDCGKMRMSPTWRPM